MIAAVSVVRDEADIIGQTVEWMCSQVDRVIVADNGSIDGTREILESLDVEVIDDPEPGHYQSRKMSAMARGSGADFVVPFDADEFWLAREGRIGDVLSEMPDDILIAEATLFDHVATHEDGLSPYRRALPGPMRKVAARNLPGMTIGEGNHSADFRGVRTPPAALDVLCVRHFPYRSAQQMIAKARKGAAALAATDLPEEVGKHWRDYGRLSDEEIDEVFHTYFYSADPVDDPELIYDPCPALKSLSPG